MHVILDVAESAILGAPQQTSGAQMAQRTLHDRVRTREMETGVLVVAILRRCEPLLFAMALAAIEHQCSAHGMGIGVTRSAVDTRRAELEIERRARWRDRRQRSCDIAEIFRLGELGSSLLFLC